MSASYSRKRKASQSQSQRPSEENIVSDIIYNIKNINTIIENKPIKLPDMCEYGSSCYRKNPDHLASFRHSIINDSYFVKLRERIVLFNSNIIELLNLLHKQWAIDPYFEKLNLRPLFKGAELEEDDGKGNVRFVPEDTIYFYLLAIIHSNLEMLVDTHPIDKKSNQFVLSLLMHLLEENSVTGIYQMHENEYKTLFNVDNVMTETGVVIENGMISLSNTTLMMSLQKFLFTKKRKTSHIGGRRTRKRNKRKSKTHKKRKTRCGRK